MSSYKNSRICYIPEQIIIRDVENVLNEAGENDESPDRFYRQRIAWALKILTQYAVALKNVRTSGVTDMSKFKNGM